MRVHLEDVVIPNNHGLGDDLALCVLDWLVVNDCPFLYDVVVPEYNLPSLCYDGAGGVDHAALPEFDGTHFLGAAELNVSLSHLNNNSIP